MIVHCKYDELVPVGDLVPYEKNRNKHTEAQIERLAELLRFQGVRSPIVVRAGTKTIAKGHGTTQALIKAPSRIEIVRRFGTGANSEPSLG
jgi:ParB-like chromosome segregation protein Spo0J